MAPDRRHGRGGTGRSMSQGLPLSVSVDAGTEMERYLRILGLVGLAPTGQWTIRPLSSGELAKIPVAAGHTWRASFPSRRSRRGGSVVDRAVHRRHREHELSVRLQRRTGVGGKGTDDGCVGRGERRSRSLFHRAGSGCLRRAERELHDRRQRTHRRSTIRGLGRGRTPSTSRSGSDQSRTRGSTRARAKREWKASGLAAGISSRAQVWGPAYEHPLILGNNAGGIPRLFAGTRAPVDLRWVTIHGQVFWGELNESAYGRDTGFAQRHFATAIVGNDRHQGGAGSRARWRPLLPYVVASDRIRQRHGSGVLQGFISGATSESSFGNNPDNQLASAVRPACSAGKGIRGLWRIWPRRSQRRSARPDARAGPRRWLHGGFARAWATPATNHITVVRGEVLNTRVSHLQEQRPQQLWYMHLPHFNGHTEHGQVLGSAGGFGGGASNVAVDRYTPSGRTTIRWDRIVRATPLTFPGTSAVESGGRHARHWRRTSPVHGRGEVTVTGALVKDFNRYFAADALNANVSVAYRFFR